MTQNSWSTEVEIATAKFLISSPPEMSIMLRSFKQLAIVTILSAVVNAGNLLGKERSVSSLPPVVNLAGLTGGSLDRAGLKDKVVVMQFWASWCVGCDKVMLELEKRLKDRKDILFVPVSVDEDMKSARSYFTHKPHVKSLEQCSFHDVDTSLAGALGVTSVPAVAIIGRDGKVIEMETGHPGSKRFDEMQKTIDKKTSSAHH